MKHLLQFQKHNITYHTISYNTHLNKLALLYEPAGRAVSLEQRAIHRSN